MLQEGSILITCKEDCGNAPKKQLLKNVNIAFVYQDIPFLNEQVTEQIEWNRIGDKKIQGMSEFEAALRQMSDYKATELHLQHLLTHGSMGAAEGVIVYDNGKQYAFCDLYRFSSGRNAKIKEITSYVIEMSPRQEEEE